MFSRLLSQFRVLSLRYPVESTQKVAEEYAHVQTNLFAVREGAQASLFV